MRSRRTSVAPVCWFSGAALALLCTLLSGCDRSPALSLHEDSKVNLALGKTYTLTPAPNYPLCTDAGDKTQLTDGQTADADWHLKSTVGWTYPKTAPTVLIDLGRVEPIGEVRISTVGGGKAGVFYPATMLVMVSDDNQTFHAIGATDNIGLPQERDDVAAALQTPRTFRVDNLHTRGRYVVLMLEPDAGSVFVDEVEVLRGDHDPASVIFAPENAYQLADLPKLEPALRARAEISALLHVLDAEPQPAAIDDTAARLAQMRSQLAAERSMFDVAAITRLTADLYALRGRRLAREGHQRVRWAVANPMQQVAPTDTLARVRRQPDKLKLHSWQGEYESAAVSLLNCGETAVRLAVGITPLEARDGTVYPADQTFTVRQAVPVPSRSLGPILDALAKVGDNTFLLGGGRLGQLWLTFHNPGVPAGTYKFKVRIEPTTDASPGAPLRALVIPGRLIVDPLSFPQRPTLRTCDWSYVRRSQLAASAPHEALADLKAHYVDAYVLLPEDLPYPRKGHDGQFYVEYDKHAEALDWYAAAEPYLFHWGLSRAQPDFKDLPPRFSPEWKAVMKDWLRGWVAFLRDRGIGYERFAMYPFDEYIGDEFFDLARFIKEEVDPRIRIYANSRGSADGKEMERAAHYVDIWALPDRPPTVPHAPQEAQLQETAQMWTYATTGPGKANPPYVYYRLQAWRAFARGDTGCGFWLYTDTRREVPTPWDDAYVLGGPYGVVYGAQGCPVDSAGEHIIPSRRWEAWREGVEDYEYLVRLQAEIARVRKGGRASLAASAQRVLDRTVAAVLGKPANRDAVYRARQVIVTQIRHLERR